jgi:hypothetical protein
LILLTLLQMPLRSVGHIAGEFLFARKSLRRSLITAIFSADCTSAKLCYNCKEPGHLSTECPSAPSHDAKQCYGCGGLGHIASVWVREACRKLYATLTLLVTTLALTALPLRTPELSFELLLAPEEGVGSGVVEEAEEVSRDLLARRAVTWVSSCIIENMALQRADAG